jgi:diketogulonate reductase-like aldo/keto reductase
MHCFPGIIFTFFSIVSALHGLRVNDERMELSKFHLVNDLSHMARVGFGLAAMTGQTERVVCKALRHGFRLFDTAQAPEWYDEAALGVALERCWGRNEHASNKNKEKLEDLIIVTKVHPRDYEPSRLLSSLNASIKKIYRTRTAEKNYLDVALLHAPWCWEGHCTAEQLRFSWRDGWRALEVAQQRGLVRAIGASNMGSADFRELLGLANVKLSVLQNWMDPFHQDRGVRELCRARHVVYMAYSSLGTQWEHRLGYNPVFSGGPPGQPEESSGHRVLQTIADRHGVSVALVVLSWALQEGVAVLPRTTSDTHMADNAVLVRTAGGGLGTRVFLEPQDMFEIEQLDGMLD